MGLEIVELVMRAEEEFGIEIPDEDAQQAATCGALCDLVLRKLRERGETPDENATWEKVRAIIADEISIAPEHLTRETHFVDDLGLG